MTPKEALKACEDSYKNNIEILQEELEGRYYEYELLLPVYEKLKKKEKYEVKFAPILSSPRSSGFEIVINSKIWIFVCLDEEDQNWGSPCYICLGRQGGGTKEFEISDNAVDDTCKHVVQFLE